MLTTQGQIALRIISNKSYYHLRRSRPNSLKPLIRDDHKLDARRAQSQIVTDLVHDFSEKMKSHT